MNQDKMLTPEQVADMLTISKETLCRMTNAGQIPHVRLTERVIR